MGYMGMKTWNDSDGAADVVHPYIDGLAKTLKSALSDAGNEFNTTGVVNVALFNEAFVLPIAKELSIADVDRKLYVVIESAYKKLEKEMKLGEKVSNDDWDGYQNKRMHMNAYKRMLANLKATIRVFDRY